MESVRHYCKIDKNICTDLLELMVKLIIVETKAPDPLRPQNLIFLGYRKVPRLIERASLGQVINRTVTRNCALGHQGNVPNAGGFPLCVWQKLAEEEEDSRL